MTEAKQIAELRNALETLVKLHKDWDKGTAYVPVQFMHDNNAAISAARDILRQTVQTVPVAPVATTSIEVASLPVISGEAGTPTLVDQDSKPARDEAWLELLHLHRKAVQQGDTDLSDLFEVRLRAYRESLLSGQKDSSPLTEEAILNYGAMHGLISARRQQWQWSKVFNQKLVGFAHTVIEAAARVALTSSSDALGVLSDGLTKRLRAIRGKGAGPETIRTAEEAADEIERLRAVLRAAPAPAELLAASSSREAGAQQVTIALSPKEIATLKELAALRKHREFSVRTAVIDAMPIIERLANAAPIAADHSGDPGEMVGHKQSQPIAAWGTQDVVTRADIEAWADFAELRPVLITEMNYDRLGSFAIAARRALLATPSAASESAKKDFLNGWREVIQQLPVSREDSAPIAAGHIGEACEIAGKGELPDDPFGCNACEHPNCGRFDGPRHVECRAMADNACARPEKFRALLGTPAAASEPPPAWASQAVIEYQYTGGTHWCPLGKAERMKPDFDGVYRLQPGTFPTAAAQCHVPKGWKLVPVKATAEMKAAGRVAGKVHVWDDMIAAAPTTPAAGPDDARSAK